MTAPRSASQAAALRCGVGSAIVARSSTLYLRPCPKVERASDANHSSTAATGLEVAPAADGAGQLQLNRSIGPAVDIEIDRPPTTAEGDCERRRSVVVARIGVDALSAEQVNADPLCDRSGACREQEPCPIGQACATLAAQAAHAVPEVVEPFTVGDQDDRAGDEVAMPRSVVPALHAGRRQPLPTDLLGPAHDAVLQELVQRIGRDERLSRRTPKGGGL